MKEITRRYFIDNICNYCENYIEYRCDGLKEDSPVCQKMSNDYKLV